MKKEITFTLKLILFLILLISTNCKREEIPQVITDDITLITQTSATCSSTVISEGSAFVFTRGICWSTVDAPTIADSKTNDSTGIGSYKSLMMSLRPNTVYFVRAFATNSVGTGYGITKVFTTLPSTLPEILTYEITSITDSNALSISSIFNDGADSIVSRGVCWSISENPTITDFKTSDGSGKGTFESVVSGLVRLTTYFLRAYATNGIGTAYSNQVTFKTKPSLPIISTVDINSITSTSAITGGIVLDNGGDPPAQGVCWSISENPTKNDNYTNFCTSSCRIQGLRGNTVYYVRAYGENVAGIAYGNQISFKTLPGIVPSKPSIDVGYVGQTRAMFYGSINYDGGADITDKGICYSLDGEPTIQSDRVNGGLGEGGFILNLTGLIPNRNYYVRSYGTNNAGTSYSDIVLFSTLDNSVDIVSDIEGNVYETVKIGNQIWMKRNLVTTKFENGDSIKSDLTANNYPSTPAYHFKLNATVAYGHLYNWYALNDNRNICPTGWHVPTDSEWGNLFNYLTDNGYGYEGSGSDIAKSLSSKSLWWNMRYSTQPCYPDRVPVDPGTPGNDLESNNSSGFSALPGGFFPIYDECPTQGRYGSWWSITEYSSASAMSYLIINSSSEVSRTNTPKSYGNSVRCIKD